MNGASSEHRKGGQNMFRRTVLVLVAVMALLHVSIAPGGPIVDDYKKLVDVQKQLRDTSASLTNQKQSLDSLRQDAIQRLKNNDNLKQNIQNTSRPTPD